MKHVNRSLPKRNLQAAKTVVLKRLLKPLSCLVMLYCVHQVGGSDCQKVEVGKISRVSIQELHLPKNWKFASGQAPYILTSLAGDLQNITEWSKSTLMANFAPYDIGAYWRNMRDPGPSQIRTTTVANLLSALAATNTPFYGFWAGIPTVPASQLFPRMPTGMPHAFQDSFEPWRECLGPDMNQYDFDFKSKWRMLLIGTALVAFNQACLAFLSFLACNCHASLQETRAQECSCIKIISEQLPGKSRYGRLVKARMNDGTWPLADLWLQEVGTVQSRRWHVHFD